MKNSSYLQFTKPILNFGLGNGFVPSGNKPLPEPMLKDVFIYIDGHRTN